MYTCIGPIEGSVGFGVTQDLQSFTLTITPPSPSECIVNYTITVNNSAGETVQQITVPAARTITVNRSFALCSETYTFQVVPVTIERHVVAAAAATSQSQSECLLPRAAHARSRGYVIGSVRLFICPYTKP